MSYRITTQKQLRREFWQRNSELPRNFINGPKKPILAPQNMQPCDTRCAWCAFVDSLQKSGEISEALAQRATL